MLLICHCCPLGTVKVSPLMKKLFELSVGLIQSTFDRFEVALTFEPVGKALWNRIVSAKPRDDKTKPRLRRRPPLPKLLRSLIMFSPLILPYLPEAFKTKIKQLLRTLRRGRSRPAR